MTDAAIDKKTGAIFLLLLIVSCSLYGFIIYCLFLILFGNFNNPSGVMFSSFLIGLPISVGSIMAFFLKNYTQFPFGKIFAYSLIPLVITVILSFFIMREGVICIIMASPIFILTLLIGSLLGYHLAKYKNLKSKKLVSVLLLAPLALGAYEQNINPSHSFQTLEKVVFIEAPASTVWPEILNPRNIQEKELSAGFVYKIGAPYPVEAITKNPKVGQIRHSVWQKGVTFDEEITAIEPNKFIEWTYKFNEDSFPPGSLDNHIKIGGTYFDLLKTSYQLEPKDNGTWLRLKIDYRVSTNFNEYANLWGHFLIGDTAKTLLEFYKNRSEAE